MSLAKFASFLFSAPEPTQMTAKDLRDQFNAATATQGSAASLVQADQAKLTADQAAKVQADQAANAATVAFASLIHTQPNQMLMDSTVSPPTIYQSLDGLVINSFTIPGLGDVVAPDPAPVTPATPSTPASSSS